MLRAPYNNAMRLGQGFNSFTQQLCMLDAVGKEKTDRREAVGEEYGDKPPLGISQIASYSSRFVDKVSDVTSAMNVSAALSIKTAGFEGSANGKYVDTDKFKESDLNFFIQVKVTNQEHMASDYNVFKPLKNLPPGKFVEVYGNTFISGWEEGGEFNALMSVKVKDKSKITSISGEIQASLGKGPFKADAHGKGGFDTTLNESNAETTITVNWSGGGQLKDIDAVWDIDSMTRAAVNFPELVAMTPQRKYAILTKYASLRSYQEVQTHFTLLDYDNAGIYASWLLEIYSDYKSIWKNLQMLEEDLRDGLGNFELVRTHLPQRTEKYLKEFHEEAMKTKDHDIGAVKRIQTERSKPAPGVPAASKGPAVKQSQPANAVDESGDPVQRPAPPESKAGSPATGRTASGSSGGSEVLVERPDNGHPHHHRAMSVQVFEPNLPIYEPYEATALGLIKARQECRLEMVKIVNEVDLVTLDPGIALDPQRKQTFLSASIYKQLIPIKKEIAFFDGDPTFLPKLQLDVIKRFSSKLLQYRMSGPYAVLGEAGHEKDRAFNDLDQLDEGDRMFGLRLYSSEQAIFAIAAYYTSGKAIWTFASPKYWRTNTWVADFDWHDLERPIEDVLIEGQLLPINSRTVVDKLIVRTLDSTKSFQAHSPHTAKVEQTRVSPPAGGWDLRGFYGSVVEEQGFSQLGCIWGKVKAPRKKGIVSLFGERPSGFSVNLLKALHQYDDLGAYFQVGQCAGDANSKAETCFAAHLFTPSTSSTAQVWTARGTHPWKVDFYTSGDNFQCIQTYYDAQTSIKAPRPPKDSKDPKISFEYTDGDNTKVSEILIKTKKKGNDPGFPTFVQITHAMTKYPSPAKFGTDPGTDSTGISVTCKPPAASAGVQWCFGGFYGTANNDVIESLGVVWARFDLPKAAS